jgi:hypothetical protein
MEFLISLLYLCISNKKTSYKKPHQLIMKVAILIILNHLLFMSTCEFLLLFMSCEIDVISLLLYAI